METEVFQFVGMLKELSPIVWDASLREAYVGAYAWLFIGALFTILPTVLGIFLGRRYRDDIGGDVIVGLIVAVSIGIVAVWVGVYSLCTVEYQALMGVGDLIK